MVGVLAAYSQVIRFLRVKRRVSDKIPQQLLYKLRSDETYCREMGGNSGHPIGEDLEWLLLLHEPSVKLECGLLGQGQLGAWPVLMHMAKESRC